MRYLLCWLVCIGQWCSWANAAEKIDIYSADIPVYAQTSQVRQEALRMALEKVLLKASGNAAVRDAPPFTHVLSEAESWVEEYSYHEAGVNSDNAATGLLLHVRFQPSAINAALVRLGYPLWDKQRPMLLVWLVEENPAHTKQLIASDMDSPLANSLRQVTQEHGLSMFLPMLDLSMLDILSVHDVWNVNVSALQQASSRYGIATQVVLKCKNDNGTWQMDASLLTADARNDFVASDANQEKALTSIVDQLSRALVQAQPKRDTADKQSALQLTVTHIDDVASYAKLTNYLNQFSLIKDVQVIRIKPHEIEVLLSIFGDAAQLQQLFDVEPSLLHRVSVNEDTNKLLYQWNDATTHT